MNYKYSRLRCKESVVSVLVVFLWLPSILYLCTGVSLYIHTVQNTHTETGALLSNINELRVLWSETRGASSAVCTGESL